jgi:hypothetical protein
MPNLDWPQDKDPQYQDHHCVREQGLPSSVKSPELAQIINLLANIEEDTEGVAESNKFEEIDKEQPSTSATPSPPKQSRTRAKSEELSQKQNAYKRPR